jgi:glycosyltransferase involved in cell wall biosynthesis
LQVEKEQTKEHIVFLGENGFPKGLAAIQRMTLMAKALLFVGCKTTVICRKGVWNKDKKENPNTKGSYEGIDYVYTSKSIFKPKGFFDRNIQKLKGLFGEYNHLKHLKNGGELDVAIVSNMSAFHLLRYLMYSAILNFPIILNYVEIASSRQHRASLGQKINDYIIDNYIVKLFDGAIPISDYLMAYYQKISPQTPLLKLPIICDFEKFNLQKGSEEPYFLYCGSMGYRQVIDFIFEAYNNISENESTKLCMIVSGGSKKEVDLLQQEVNNQFDVPKIKLFSDIPYEQLVHLYINAIALLIPLRPTAQDSARFPHKIGEYLASGNPVITTNVGEIKNYFQDGKTALIADSYDVGAFADKMKYVLDFPKESKEIGLKGKELGLKEFNYKMHGSRLQKFLQEF